MGFIGRWWARTRALLRKALEEQSSPPQVGAAIALGALVGSSPLLGLHSILAVALASLFRLNRLMTFVGSNVSFGPIIAGIIWGEVVVGGTILGRARPAAGADIIATAKGGLASWWLGWAIVGPALAGIGYLLGVYLAKRWRRSQTAISEKAPPANE